MPVGEWQHHVLVHKKKRVQWYIDGKAIETGFGADMRPKVQQMTLGMGKTHCVLDEVMVFDRELLPEEIKQLKAWGRAN